MTKPRSRPLRYAEEAPMVEIWFWVWVSLAAILLVAEIFTAGFFLLPFGIGAAVAALMEFLGASVGWQWVTFIVVSVAMLVLMRRYANRLTHEPPMRTGVDRLIEKHGVVIEDLVPHTGKGMVRIEREEWRAEAPGHETIPAGTHIAVERVDGTHLVVRPASTEPASAPADQT